MKVIGLTGGVGCGKSYVAGVAEQFFPVLHISTDDIAREQMKKGGCSYQEVMDCFGGADILDEGGELNRAALAKIVFNDSEKLKKLNSITHPNVISEMNDRIEAARESGEYEAVLIESALIFESGIHKQCDEVWYVYAPEETRKKRLSASRGYSDEKIQSILDDQLSEDEFKNKSDVLIFNDDTITVEMMVLRIAGLLV